MKSYYQDTPLDLITRWDRQPRIDFPEEEINKIAASIKQDGLIQPIVIRPTGQGAYLLIAGECRWRACGLAGIHEVETRVIECDDETALRLAGIENFIRNNLNPIEEALYYKQFKDEFHYQLADIGALVGKSTSTVSHTLRLLELPDTAQALIKKGRDGGLDIGHGKALLTAPNGLRTSLANMAAREGWSVRFLEKKAKDAAKRFNKDESPTRPDPNIASLERQLSDLLGAPVALKKSKDGTQIVIQCFSDEEIESVLDKITNNKRSVNEGL